MNAAGGVEVVYYVASSVDGYLAPADGSLDWLSAFEASSDDYGYAEFYASVDAVVLGSKTYEQVFGFDAWPYAGKRVVVMSSRDLPKATDEVVVDSGSPAAVVEDLKSQGVRRVWLVGGGELAGAFQREGLITEYIISVIPVVMGSGRGVFGCHGGFERLELVGTRAYAEGIVQLTYRTPLDA
ncbi:MAG TPA: dihydrofolate reductase family protein [Coriobacteriia bacterium]|nr:dihydrofolate reductase family protein [Coriobacteriia bacterium]